jgi:hypothetical protein
MAYDAFEARYVQETFARMRLGDLLWLHFWRERLEEAVSADTVWRVLSFILSHAFKNDARMLTFGAFCNDVTCRAPLKPPPVLRGDKMKLLHQPTDSP